VSKVEGHRVERRTLEGTRVEVTSYRIGGTYHCHVANLDPGATIARASAATAEEAIRVALEKASAALGRRRPS
jgi:hypothetical protein